MIIESIELLEGEINIKKNEAAIIKGKYSDVTKNIKLLNDTSTDLSESIELIKELISEDSGKFIKTVEGLLTLAVKKIFYDVKDPKIVIDVREGARNMASMYYVYIDDNGNKIKSDIRKAVGGGVRAVIGFILQTFFISYYHLDRIIIADEAFKELSKQYRPYFITFLKELCTKHNYKMLLVTHDEDIIESADIVYKMENGVLNKSL